MPSNISKQSWPLSQNINKQKGICNFCKSVRQLHLKDSTIHLHGPRKNPCPGLHKLPAASISAQQNSSDSVQSILIPELPADPELTLHSTAVVKNDQFPPKPPFYSSLFPASRFVLFEHPQFGLPIIKHILESVRSSCNAYLSTLLSTLCATPDNILHWRAFLNFASSFLFKPRRARKCQNLSSIIKKHFGDTQAPQPSANAEVNNYVHQHRITKARSLESLIASKLEDDDVSSAI